jgi:hypothetical protein
VLIALEKEQKLLAAAKAEAAAVGGGGVKKAKKATGVDAYYKKKKRRQPLSEEALANRRAAAQKASMERKLDPILKTVPPHQVRVNLRFDRPRIPKGSGRPGIKMVAPSSGRLINAWGQFHR